MNRRSILSTSAISWREKDHAGAFPSSPCSRSFACRLFPPGRRRSSMAPSSPRHSSAARSCGTCAMPRPTSAAISRAPSTSATRYASCVTRQPRISSKPRASKRYSAAAESIRRARSWCIRPVATSAPISRISPSAISAARMSPSTTTASTAGQTTSARSKPARRGLRQ